MPGLPRLWPDHRHRFEQGNPRSKSQHQTRCGARFSGRRVWRIAKGFASRVLARRDRYQYSIRRVTEGRSGLRHRRRTSFRRIHRRRLRKRSVVWRSRLLSLARKQDLQDACTRAAQPLSRLHQVSQMQGRTVPNRSAQLQTFRNP